MAEPTFVYVISDGAGACKVGVSRSPERRLRQLQSAASRRLHIARSVPTVSAIAVEAYTHWLLREARLAGEWFRVTEEAAHVAVVAAEAAVARGERPGRRIGGVGRPMLYPDKIIAPLPAGTLDRVKAVLAEGEDKTDLLREAVERELKRRERGLRVSKRDAI